MRSTLMIALVILLANIDAMAQPVAADHSGLRVRMTGVADYDIGTQGRVTTTRTMIRSTPLDGTRPITVTQAGKRASGLALSIEGRMLEFVSDDDGEFSYVPLDSIETIERGRRRGSRIVATGAGIATGVAVFFASFLSAFHCQPDEHIEGPCWRTFLTLMFAGPPVFGTLVGRHIRGIRWEQITAEELEQELQALRRSPYFSPTRFSNNGRAMSQRISP